MVPPSAEPRPSSTLWMLAVASLIPVAAAFTPSPATPPVMLPSPVEVVVLPAPPAPPAALPAVLDADPTAPARVLLVGDSHTAGTFGRSLDLLLRTLPGAEVTTVGSCGLSPDGFLEEKNTRCGHLEIAGGDAFAFKKRGRAPHIDALLAKSRPELTIVELGANQIHSAMSEPAAAAADIRALAERVLASGSRCLWVGPPYGTPDKKPTDRLDHIYDVLDAALPAGCSFIDSRPTEMPFLDYVAIFEKTGKRGDGKHFDTLGVYGQHALRRWAMAVFTEAKEALAKPAPRPVGPPSSTTVALNR